jgi:hypothetical protein
MWFSGIEPVKHVEFFRVTGRERIISAAEELTYLTAASH